MLCTTNTKFSSIEVWFADQNSEPLETEDNVNMTQIIGETLLKLRYSIEPKYRKYVKRYNFLSFAKKFDDNYGKKLMDTATKTGIDTAKTVSKRVVQKTAEATGDLIENKIADEINSLGKTKSIEKEVGRQEVYIFPEKDSNLLMSLDCFDTISKWNSKKYKPA